MFKGKENSSKSHMYSKAQKGEKYLEFSQITCHPLILDIIAD